MAWDDAPSHICRGGDIRGIAFCCPPIKPCPVMNALKEIGISPQEYIEIKNKFTRETRLGEGPGTCFGSLVWCCKTSKPCPLRDMTLRNIGMSEDEYLTLKKELSEAIVGTNPISSEEDVLILAETFNIPEIHASKVLEDCNGDLRAAVKKLKAESLKDD